MQWAALLFILLFLPSSSIAGEFVIRPTLELGGVSEGDKAPSAFGRIGLQMGGPLWDAAEWEVRAAASRYQMIYHGVPLSAFNSSGGDVVATNFSSLENRFDFSASLSYPVFDNFFGFEIHVLGGYREILLFNGFSDFRIGGPLIGLKGGKTHSWGGVKLHGDYSPNLIKGVKNYQDDFLVTEGSQSNSLLGDPTGSARYGLSFWIPVKGDRQIGLGYEGETIFFQRVQRYYNALFASVEF